MEAVNTKKFQLTNLLPRSYQTFETANYLILSCKMQYAKASDESNKKSCIIELYVNEICATGKVKIGGNATSEILPNSYLAVSKIITK